MSNLNETLNQPLIAGNENLAFLTKGMVAALALGAAGLYFMIPERKRKNILKS